MVVVEAAVVLVGVDGEVAVAVVVAEGAGASEASDEAGCVADGVAVAVVVCEAAGACVGFLSMLDVLL